MSVELGRVDNDAPADSLTGPLSSIEIPIFRPGAATGVTPRTRPTAARPLALRGLRPAPEREIPAHLYDPVAQVATDLNGRPLVPDLKKDWTTIEGTHTDGDGGDNEMWDWEEVK